MDSDRGGRIRAVTPGDAAAIASIYAPFVEETPVSFEEAAPGEAEIVDRIKSTLVAYPWLVCERGDEVVGYAKAGPLRSMAAYRWTVELSVYVAGDARRSGVATGLYTALLELLDQQGYRSAYAALVVPNPESVAFHERMGFESAGVFPRAGYTQGGWRDVRWLYRPIGGEPEDSAEPDEPVPFPDVRRGPGWGRALAEGEAELEL